jgi:glycosyltransferase involved in cell wall biosynthesis
MAIVSPGGREPRLSVIVPCLNAAATLPAQLEALAAQQWSEPWEVVVADNGSTDGSPGLAARYRGHVPGLRVLDAGQRRGAAHARNAGARAARSASLAFCDADDAVTPGWVAAIGAAVAEHGLAASRFDADRLNPPWVRASRRNKQGDGLLTFAYAPYFQFCGGSGLGVARALHDAVGGFDESLPAAEDTDYCYRLQLAGGKLHFAADAVVCVRYRDTLGGLFRQAASWAAGGVCLHARYRPRELEPMPWTAALARWGVEAAHLARHALGVRDRASAAAWVWKLGWTTGRLRGCRANGVRWPR